MTCSPGHTKADKVDPRSIRRNWRWRLGHDPADDDATPESPWVYLNIEPFTPSAPDQRNLLTGGPESGMPCPCAAHPLCNDMTRIAGEMSARDMMNQPGVEVVNRGTMSEADWKRLESQSIVVLVCPTCYCKCQFQKDLLPILRQRNL